MKILEQLGPWAADHFLWKAIKTYMDRVDQADGFFDNWLDEEKRYIADFLRKTQIERPPPRPQNEYDISHKATVLLEELLSMEEPGFGIIFVKERVIVMMLWRKREIYDLAGDSEQADLQAFRSGEINLLVATSVLEEGIDVPACNLIVCFDKPDSLRAFVQRRGRARMSKSKLIWLSEHSTDAPRQWELLEEELKQVYEDEERERRSLELFEGPQLSGTCFEIESTGAMLDLDNAKQHLQHFCSTLSRGEYVDSRPDYILHRHFDTQPPTLSATVLLPPFVPESLRRVEGIDRWYSEKNATKEVAFRAYVALYKAGLVSEHLSPLKLTEADGSIL
ncbi:hypothetical protein CDD83_4084 [Cordyceps sp. RAO-2017]|nr:hypothetical protein CDD83_4084 [Cordyceps sp. RAO-2017]